VRDVVAGFREEVEEVAVARRRAEQPKQTLPPGASVADSGARPVKLRLPPRTLAILRAGMLEQRSKLRAGALIAASALALHELRYLFGYGDGAGQAIGEQGHSYLPAAGAFVALALALAGVQLAAALSGVLRGPAAARPRAPFAVTWALATLALLGVYAGQELTEGMLASGHPAGLHALVGHGGLVVVPLAVGLGLLVALGLRVARAALAAADGRRAAMPRPRRRIALARPATSPVLAPCSLIARNLAGRAPPVVA
jgi:hypothetical protein